MKQKQKNLPNLTYTHQKVKKKTTGCNKLDATVTEAFVFLDI